MNKSRIFQEAQVIVIVSDHNKLTVGDVLV